MKRKKLLASIISIFLLLATTTVVNATELDAKTCKDGKKYTYYFYLANAHDALAIGEEIEKGTYATKAEFIKKIGEVTNTAEFKNIPAIVNNLPIKTVLENTGKYHQTTGIIYVNDLAGAKYNNMNSTDYWTKVAEINKSGKSYTLNNTGTEAHILHNTFTSYQGNVQESFSTAKIVFGNWTSTDIKALANSSIQLKNTAINYQTDTQTSTDALTLHIKRDYSTAMDSKGSTSFDNLSATAGTIYENSNDTNGTLKEWYLQPVVYYIETCEKASHSDYTVTYDADGGENAPANQDGKAGTCITIPETTPTKENETFLGWYLKSNPASTDAEYAPGDQYCGDYGSITLYAQYTGDTGIEEYFLGFALVAITAGGALILANKKRLFKQI